MAMWHRARCGEKTTPSPCRLQVIRESLQKPRKGRQAILRNMIFHCCFINSFKIQPQVLDIRMRLLHEIEGTFRRRDIPLAPAVIGSRKSIHFRASPQLSWAASEPPTQRARVRGRRRCISE